VKGALLSAAPGLTLVDVTHAVPPGDVRAGAYLLSRAWHRFPAGTIHLSIVDPGVGTERAALAVVAHGHYFVGPDNGLFTLVLRDAEVQIVVLPTPDGASPTFHGRDVFAPAAAALATGTPLAQLGQAFSGIPVRLAYRVPHHEGKSVVGEVVYVDRFGTLVTNLTPELVPSYAVIEVEGLEVGPLRRTFGDVPTGGLVAYLGSGGQVEIAVRDGSATRRLGMGVGGRIRARLG
jgi:S-adenosyl-L-methionine hydrolase (adenosine-forming)